MGQHADETRFGDRRGTLNPHRGAGAIRLATRHRGGVRGWGAVSPARPPHVGSSKQMCLAVRAGLRSFVSPAPSIPSTVVSTDSSRWKHEQRRLSA